MRSVRTIKALVLSVAVGSALLLSGCGGAASPGASASSAATTGEGKVIVSDVNRMTVTPGSTGVVFTEFTDFQCPYCAGVHSSIEKLAERYEGKIDLVVRDFPLKQHQNSKIAAYAVEAAVLQSPVNLKKFSGKLFETQETWGTQSDSDAKKYFKQVASDLGLDVDKFVADSDSQKVKDRVARDLADASALNLQGTPSMFVGTTPVDLSQIKSDDDINKLVDAAIANAEKSGKTAPSASPSASKTP